MSSNELITTFDLGNSNPHFVIHDKEEARFPIDELDEKLGIINKNRSVASSVRGDLSSKLSKVKNLKTISEFRHNDSLLGMKINYSDTLGEDRLTQAFWIWKSHPHIDETEIFLSVDAGTFTTIDFVNRNGFMGGYIFPGDYIYANNFSKFGKDLPSIDLTYEKAKEKFPSDTKKAIDQGHVNLFASLYEKICRENKVTKAFFTGGNGKSHALLFEREFPKVQTTVFPNLIHKGLKLIADLDQHTKSFS